MEVSATITQTRTITISFKARNEDAAQEKLEAMLENGFNPDKKPPRGYSIDEDEAGDWEIDCIDEQ